MEINKAALTIDGNDKLEIGMPISKVDKENRTVSGFATLDNIDNQKDWVTPEASLSAFSRWRGNIREMHAPVAVGKAINFDERTYVDDSGKTYRGIYVTCYVSKGAQDTWEKVLDETLTGFSIRGPLRKSENVFMKSDDGTTQTIRKVLDYDLEELSLVDNPANQLANIVSIQKMADGNLHLGGLVTKMNSENIFWCKLDKVSATSSEESVVCAKCENSMTNIGWVDGNDENKLEKINQAIKNFEGENETTSIVININGNSNPEEIAKQIAKRLEGGVEVTDLNKSETATEETGRETEKVEEVQAGESAPNAEVVEGEVKAAPVDEVEAPNLEKMFSDLRTNLTDAIESSKTEMQKSVDAIKDAVQSDVTSLKEQVGELSKRVETITESVGAVEKRVDGVVEETAVKKSNDLGRSKDEEELKKNNESFWHGHFLPTQNLVS